MIRRRRHHDPELPPPYRGRRPRFLLMTTMLVLMVVVVFMLLQILPADRDMTLSGRQARKLLNEAQRWEEQSLHHSAADLYEKILDQSRAPAKLKREAALRLTELYVGPLDNPQAAESALEKQYIYSETDAEQEKAGAQLSALRGHPVTPRPVESASAGTDSNAHSRDVHVVATIGEETVTAEEIMYAWSQFNGQRAPTREELEPFTQWYLDVALLADEARQRGLDQQPGVAIEIRMRRLLALSQAITRQMIGQLRAPDESALREYFDTHREELGQPAQARLSVIATQDPDTRGNVQRALADDEDFDEVAREHSLLAKSLKDGHELGWVRADRPELPGFGPQPALVPALLRMDEGDTTGPLTIGDSQIWLHVLERREARLPDYQEAQERVTRLFQEQQLARQRAELIASLRHEHDIAINSEALARVAPSPPAVQPNSTASPTTPTIPVALEQEDTPGSE